MTTEPEELTPEQEAEAIKAEGEAAIAPLNKLVEEMHQLSGTLSSHGAQLSPGLQVEVILTELVTATYGPPIFPNGAPNYGRIAFDSKCILVLNSILKDAIADVRRQKLLNGLPPMGGPNGFPKG